MEVGSCNHERNIYGRIRIKAEIHQCGLILWERTTPVTIEVNGVQQQNDGVGNVFGADNIGDVIFGGIAAPGINIGSSIDCITEINRFNVCAENENHSVCSMCMYVLSSTKIAYRNSRTF